MKRRDRREPKVRDFCCPDCRAPHFGTLTRNPDPIIECHGYYYNPCGWRGTWDEHDAEQQPDRQLDPDRYLADIIWGAYQDQDLPALQRALSRVGRLLRQTLGPKPGEPNGQA